MYNKRDKTASDIWEQYESQLKARGRDSGGSEQGSSDKEGDTKEGKDDSKSGSEDSGKDSSIE